jgi:hypothetical protein
VERLEQGVDGRAEEMIEEFSKSKLFHRSFELRAASYELRADSSLRSE